MRVIVHLIPKASSNKVEGWILNAHGQKVLKVKVTAVPEEGKANEALIKMLSRTLHIPKSAISLVRGTTSRVKEFKIDLPEEDVETLINLGI